MSSIEETRQVGSLVTERPARSRVFERLGIDYCCGGKVALAQACAARGLLVSDVVEQLHTSDQAGSRSNETDWTAASMTQLIDHIVETHHAWLKEELPRLTGLIEKVVGRHGGRDARLSQVKAVFQALREELEMHLMKEERVLFPAVREMERHNAPPSLGCGFLSGPVSVMEAEHEGAGAALVQLRNLTDQYAPPESACNTYRAMLDGLQALETDLHIHIHKENNILFPRALEMEAGVRAGH